MQKNKTMTLRAIIWSVFLLTCGLKASGIQATATHTLFYKQNKKDSTQLQANIVLSWRAQNPSIHFKKNNAGQFVAEMVCIIRLSNDTGVLKEETFVIKTAPQNNPADAYRQLVADQYEYAVTAGDYEIEMVLYETDYKNELYQYTENIKVPDYPSKANFLSEIQLLDTSFESNANTVYNRNKRLDLTLGSNYLSERKDSVLFYFELYTNKIKDIHSSASIKINSYISWKAFESEIPKYIQTDSILSAGSTQVFYKRFPLKELKSGNYYLNIVLVEDNIIIDKKALFFQLYNPNQKKIISKTDTVPDSLKADSVANGSQNTHVLDLTNTFVGKYNASQVRSILKMLQLICDANEGNSISAFLKKPDELYSKYFIYNFWEKRDKVSPERAWKAYAAKIMEVNRLFKGSGISGFESDRGRIYIQYGKPNDRIIVNNESGALPYEIWQYYNTEKQGREGVFLFYKPGKAMGDYQLLHSTLIGERQNSSWRALLYNNSITGSGNLGNDSRAEQYIGNK